MKRILLSLLTAWSFFSQNTHAQINSFPNESEPVRVYVTLPGSTTPTPIWVVNVDGFLIAEGDMIVGTAADIGRGAGIQAIPLGFWPGNLIPYEIEPGHPDSADILSAITKINTTSCLKVQRRAGETSYVYFVDDQPNKCSAAVGFGTGKRTINVNGCGVGGIMHEICHAAGLIHEQSRPDRDNFIRVDTSNIKAVKRHNFEVWHTAVASTSTYDFESLMHYPATISNSAWVLSGTTATVFRSKGKDPAADQAKMGSGQRNAKLSSLDIIAIKAICLVSGAPFMSGSNSGGGKASSTIPENDVPAGSTQETIQYTFPGSTTPKTITVDVVNGNALLDGDIVLGRIEDLKKGRGGATISATDGGANRRWTGGIMPYDLNSHPCADTIKRAIKVLDAQTNLSIPIRNKEADYIKFVTGSGYSSPVGRQGGAQNITISSSGGCPVAGKVMHEMLHSAGLFHEQSRSDRAKSIKIDTANLKPGKRHNFQTYIEQGSTGSDTGPYDHGSIMHYPSVVGDPSMVYDMTKPVITSVPPGKENLMGQRIKLSAGDINTVNVIYPGSSSTAGGTAGALDVEWTVDLAPQGANYTAYDAAGAMLIAWIAPSALIDPQEITNRTDFWSQFVYNIDPKLPVFFVNWGLLEEDPKPYTVKDLAEKLKTGPILVAPASKGNRVRVVYGLKGDGTPAGTTVLFNDPLDKDKQTFKAPNAGYSGQENFQTFIQSMGGPTLVIGHF